MATMKKLILLALAAVVMAGCKLDKEQNERLANKVYATIVIDSCEYLSNSDATRYDMTHKGNCCFCKERRQKELEELVKQLKEK